VRLPCTQHKPLSLHVSTTSSMRPNAEAVSARAYCAGRNDSATEMGTMVICTSNTSSTCGDRAPHARISDDADRHASRKAREPARQAGRQMSVAVKEEVR